jgi:hypothetical protein
MDATPFASEQRVLPLPKIENVHHASARVGNEDAMRAIRSHRIGRVQPVDARTRIPRTRDNIQRSVQHRVRLFLHVTGSRKLSHEFQMGIREIRVLRSGRMETRQLGAAPYMHRRHSQAQRPHAKATPGANSLPQHRASCRLRRVAYPQPLCL